MPMPVEKQIIQIYAGTQRDKSGTGWIRNIEVSDVGRYCSELLAFIDTRHPNVPTLIREKKDLTDEVKGLLDAALAEFATVFKPSK